jgi:hypothetical protein
MTNSQPPTSNPPTPRQLSYLRDLALGRGQSFAYPETFEEADREIKRLLGEKRTNAAERRREVRAVRDDMATRRGNAALKCPKRLRCWCSLLVPSRVLG